MKTESSAGGIVACRVRTWYILLMKDMAGQWTFPKGAIEENESAIQAAQREIAEEVGIRNLTFSGDLPSVSYWYVRNGKILKTVSYFLFTVPRKVRPTVQKEEGISEAVWVPLDRAQTMIGYPESNQPVFTRARQMLDALH